MSQGPFSIELTWKVIHQMLVDQLPGVDVQALTENDFNEQGDIIMTPPSVRTYYDGSKFASTTDSQRLSYEVVGRFVILCCDSDLTSPVDQAFASVKLLDTVLPILAGARINLPAGDRSEPVTIVDIVPLPASGVGRAYGIGIEVPGLAQFAGANAAGYTAEGVTA